MGSFSGNFYSEELKTTTRINLILPDASNDVTPLLGGTPKLLFLLHGLGGNCDEWLRFSKIEYYAKKFNLIVVMPEAQRSFYCDYPTAPRYFHYVADELPQLCAQWFALRRPREDCMIAGESMGGYGALKIGLRRPERFGTIAALSGVLDFRRFVDEARAGMLPEIEPGEFDALYPTGELPEEDDPIALVRRAAAQADRPRLIQLCGTEDFLYEHNRRFRLAAEEAGYGHCYSEGPGEHAWPYWDRAIQTALRFFLGLETDGEFY